MAGAAPAPPGPLPARPSGHWSFVHGRWPRAGLGAVSVAEPRIPRVAPSRSRRYSHRAGHDFGPTPAPIRRSLRTTTPVGARVLRMLECSRLSILHEDGASPRSSTVHRVQEWSTLGMVQPPVRERWDSPPRTATAERSYRRPEGAVSPLPAEEVVRRGSPSMRVAGVAWV